MDFQTLDKLESAYREGEVNFAVYYALGKTRVNPEDIDKYDTQSLRELRFLPSDSTEYKGVCFR